MRKRLLATFLALFMVLGMLPGIARAAETSGKCGEKLTWTLNGGVLTIEGTGRMYARNPLTNPSPWNSYRDQIHTVNICDGVTIIGEGAFGNCYNLISVTIPNSVTSIEWSAFSGCNSLTNVTIPNSVTSIGSFAFSSCSSLTNVTIPNSVTSIGGDAFAGCSSLTSVTIPNSVVSVEPGVFDKCSSLVNVTIPVSVTSIGWSAFWECSRLTDVYYSGSEAQWKRISISDGNDPLLQRHHSLQQFKCAWDCANSYKTSCSSYFFDNFHHNSSWDFYHCPVGCCAGGRPVSLECSDKRGVS